MRSWVLINLAVILWPGLANAYGSSSYPQTPHIQYGPPNYYDPSNRSYQQYQPIYFPQDDRVSHSRQNNPSFPSTPTYPQDHRYDPQYSDLLSNSVLTLAHKLGMKIESYGASKSQIFSPISIASVMFLLMLGSKGQTHQEILRLFNLDQSPLYNSKNYKIHEEFGLIMADLLESTIHPTRSRQQPAWKYTQQNEFLTFKQPGHAGHGRDLSPDDHVIEIANGIFIQDGFTLRPDYKTVVTQVYRSEVTPLDFQRDGYGAANYINKWVDERTHGKIPKIISDEINADTNVIVANALYFKGLWEKEFLEGGTMASDFYPDGLDGRSIRVQMMANGGTFPFYDAREHGCRIIGLPYKRNLSTMYIIMPDDSSRTKLRDLQASLTPQKIEDMISKMTRRTAVVALPKLHVQNSVNLKYTLSDLGVRTIFTKGHSDLSLIADGISAYPQSGNYHQPISNDGPLIFTRIGDDNDKSSNSTHRTKRGISYKVESANPRSSEPLRLKDFVLNKRITKLNPGKKRTRRQLPDSTSSIKNLDALRQAGGLVDPQLFVEEVIHKVDLVVNERGTEGGAATVAYLRRSGPEVLFRADTPFMILLRHDPTKIPLFYGTIYEPE